MIDITMSDDYRKFLEEQNYKFTDFQTATLVWNDPMKSRQQKLTALALLRDTTKDIVLKKQLTERIEYENKLFDTFKDNSKGRYVYFVEDKEGDSRGFFGDYERAVRYITKCIAEDEMHNNKYMEENKKEIINSELLYEIHKQIIVKSDDDEKNLVRCTGRPGSKFNYEKYEDYDGLPVGTYTLNNKGNIVHWWSDELSKDKVGIVNPFRPERFEGAFFEIPFCYKSAGTPVKDIVDGTYGILSFGEDDWNDYLQEIKDRKWEVDYSDIQAVVLYPIKSEYWDHMHCNPLHLQMELPPHMENKEEDVAYRRAMEALSDYCFYKGEHNTEEIAKDGACETCGYVCVHSGGEATCTKGAVCKTCGKEYTDKDMANHSGKVVWVQTEKTHKQVYDCCDKEVSTSEAHGWKNGVCTVCDYQCKHAGGSATCVKKAVCTICSEEYGTYNMSIHEGLKSVAAKAATRTDEGNIEYWYCKDCDRYYIKQDGLVEIEKSQTVVAKITDTTSSDDTGKGGKTETVKEQTPDTGDNKRVFAWLLMFIIGGVAAGLTIKGKKTEN